MIRFVAAILSYLVPTFILGFVWHLVLFKSNYEALGMYRSDVIIPLGLLSMAVQSAIFAWLYMRTFAQHHDRFWVQTLAYGLIGALLSWSFTTLAVAAKNVMVSVPDYLAIETAFTIVQWIMVAPLTALAFRRLAGNA
jgi:hypothetical protein